RSLEQRIIVGFGIHRWNPDVAAVVREKPLPRAEALAAFLRSGLRTPPRVRRPLTAEERRGFDVFMSSETKCSNCHFPATEYTDRALTAVLVPRAVPPFVDEPGDRAFKTPSLLYAAGTPPYFHDGRAATMEAVIEDNHDRMGKTDQLAREERAALV